MKNNEEQKRRSGANVLALLLHSVIGVLITLVLSFAASVFVSLGKLPPESISPLVSAFIFTGAFFTGLVSSRKFGKPIPIALLQSAIFLAVLYFTGAILYGRVAPAESPFAIIILCAVGMFSGALASLIKVRRYKK